MPAKTKPTKKSPAKATKKTVSGGGGLKFAKRFNWKRAAPLIAVVALAGGYFAFRSFAQTTPYRYSAYTCSSYNSRVDDVANGCLQKSAESLVYRAYKGLLNRDPDVPGAAFWSKEIAAGRKTPDDVINHFVKDKDKPTNTAALSTSQFVQLLYTRILGYAGSGTDIAYWQNQIDSGTRTKEWSIRHFAGIAKITEDQAKQRMAAPYSEAFIKGLYTNMLKRTASASEITYWKDQVVKNGWSLSRVSRHFAYTSEAESVHARAAGSFIRTNESSLKTTESGGGGGEEGGGGGEEEVVPANVPAAVRKAQEDRTAEAKKINAETQKVIDGMKERSADNNKRKEDAGKLAAKPEDQVTQGDLDAIQKNYIDVISARERGYAGKDYKGRVDANYEKVKALRLQASANSKAYPGLTFNGVETEWRKADSSRKEVTRHIENAAWLRGETEKALFKAASKHNTHQEHIRVHDVCKKEGKWYLHEKNRCYSKGVSGGISYVFEWIVDRAGNLSCAFSSGYNNCKVEKQTSGGGGGSGGGEEAEPTKPVVENGSLKCAEGYKLFKSECKPIYGTPSSPVCTGGGGSPGAVSYTAGDEKSYKFLAYYCIKPRTPDSPQQKVPAKIGCKSPYSATFNQRKESICKY